MWHQIELELSQLTGSNFKISDKQPVAGGDINQSYLISDGSRHFFVKVNNKSALTMFEEEAFSLAHLSQCESIKTPKVIAVGKTANASFIVFEQLDFTEGNKNQWRAMGEALANLHKNHTNPMFGWDRDNYIGTTPQPNQWHKHWHSFFAEQRIGWQLQLLSEKGIQLANIEYVVAQCNQLLLNHKPEASLVHGDLWAGNLGFSPEATLYDPACYFADREVDIAMTELFGRLPDSFYQGYQDTWPLLPSYKQRRPIYNLYHLLNHANLFGGVYIEQSRVQIEQLFY